MDDSMTDLPPVGEPDVQGTLSSAINRFRIMAVASRGTHIDIHPTCINLYLYGNESGTADEHVVPKVQGMLNAAVAQAARNVPNAVVKSTIGGGGFQGVTSAGIPVLIDSDKVCEFYQEAIDTVLERSDFKKFYRKMAFYGKLFGWQDALVDENHQQHKMDLRIFPPIQWYKPSDVEEIDDMSFFGVDIPVDAEWAKKKYPALAQKIDEVAARAVHLQGGASGYSEVYMGQTYAYPIVTLGVFFIRNREMPMTDQEAMSLGLVESRQVPMEGADNGPDGTVLPQAGGMDSGSQGDTGSIDADATDAGGLPDGGSNGGSGDQPQTPVEPQMREGLFHVESGEEVHSAHEKWPMKYVISKSIQIAGEVVSDEVWDGIDFPVVTNINIRVPLSPYGQSDCIRVRTQQNDINDINGSMVRHAQWWKGPISLWPKSVIDLLPPEFRNIGLQPNANYVLPDAVLKTLLEMYGQRNIIGQFDPPPLPPHLMELQNYLGATFDTVGGRPDVSQGIAPTDNSSGELAKVLLDASAQQNDYSAFGLEDMTLRLVRLVDDYIHRRWTVEDFMLFNKTYDAQTVAQIMQMRNTMQFEFEVDAPAMRMQRDAQVRADFAAGLIDQQTALDLLQYDTAQIMQRIQGQQMAQAAVAGADSQSQQLQGSNANRQQPAQPGSFKLARA